MRLLIFGGVILIFAGASVYMHSNALFPLGWERKPLDMESALPRGGFSYRLALGIHWMDRRDLGESPAIVYEDGVPLKFPNTPPFAVERRGKGRFSVEGGELILSASDNSDPRKNGRHYEIYWPTPISPRVQWIFYVLAGIIALSLFMQLRRYNQ